MKYDMQLIIATSFSLLITFMLHIVLNGKQAHNSLFQHIVADTQHFTWLFAACVLNQRSNTSCIMSQSTNDKQNMLLVGSCPFFFMALIWCYGSKIIPRLLLGMLLIFYVWLLARWCDSFQFWYSIDIFTVYSLVWQISYLMFQWCYHQLSWPSLIFYQVSVCIFTAIEAFMIYDLWFRYFPSLFIVMIWLVSYYDIFLYLHIHGRLRNLMTAPSMKYSMPTYSTCPIFCFCTHDIEDGLDAIKDLRGLGDGDFVAYNLLLLWILPPLSSITIQMLVVFDLTVNVQIGLMLTDWIGCRWKEYRRPAVPLPVMLVSTYALIVDFVIKSLDVANVTISD